MSDESSTEVEEPRIDEVEVPPAQAEPEPEPAEEPAEKPADETPAEKPAERSPYLDRAKMLPIDDIVYCLEHTAVHENTTNPFGEGPESWCDAKEHRPVYYRGRKGDIDESLDDVAVMHGEEGRGTSTSADIPKGSVIMDDLSGEQDRIKRRIIAKADAEELTQPEREIVLLLVDHAAKRTEDAAALMHEVWPDDDLVGIRIKLALLDSVEDKLGGKS
jgi:hypothetical protein